MTVLAAAVGYSTDDLADLSGLTERQVRGYCSVGVFGPDNVAPGSGRPRWFTADDVMVAGVLCRLAELAGQLSGLGAALSWDLALRVASVVRARAAADRWLVLGPDGATTGAFPHCPTPAYLAVDLEDIH